MASRRVAWAGNPDPGLADWEGKLAPEVFRKLVLLLQKCWEKGFPQPAQMRLPSPAGLAADTATLTEVTSPLRGMRYGGTRRQPWTSG